MSLLPGLRVVQLGDGLAAAVCGRAFADAGATVIAHGASRSGAFARYLDDGKQSHDDITAAITSADAIICEGSPNTLLDRGHDVGSLRRLNASAPITLISPFGQTGPRANRPATDLTLFCASGIARLLTGQVDDLSEPPIHPVGQQSAMIGGLTAACAAMAAIASRQPGAIIDVSIQEALATLAVGELAQGGLTGANWSRLRITDGNGATVTILPARDGYVAVSPREESQWTRWLSVMGEPPWATDPRFTRKPERVANWDALHALMSSWSCQHDKQWIADQAQAAHVPSFPLGELSEHLHSEQLRHRNFYRVIEIDGQQIKVPGAPYHFDVTSTEPKSHATHTTADRHTAPPLQGVRILDFSWVIAGPTTTRHLAALGAEVIKIEAPGAGDPARRSHLHTVLGQGKKAIVLDLKKPGAIDIAKALVAQSDILVENFATGVMARLGLDAETLKAANPGLIYISASGMGRTGPSANNVAYGTLLQSYAGFAGLNRHPDKAPRVGFAWLDPMCGLFLPFITAAAIRHRTQSGGKGARIDFSMIEAMLWTMAEPLLETQLGPAPRPLGNRAPDMSPHGIYPCAGKDQWVGIAIQSDACWQRLCELVPGLMPHANQRLDERRTNQASIDEEVSRWTRTRSAYASANDLIDVGIAAAPAVDTQDLIDDAHLQTREFWGAYGPGILPALPWIANFPHGTGNAPDMGADTDRVLKDVLGLSRSEILDLREAGVFG
ncbi:MAG: CoA transferase [Hyphomicrobiaceae bacterium]